MAVFLTEKEKKKYKIYKKAKRIIKNSAAVLYGIF